MNKTKIKELMMKLHNERSELLSAEKDPEVVELRSLEKSIHKKLEETFSRALESARKNNAGRLSAIEAELDVLGKQFEERSRLSLFAPIKYESLPKKAQEICDKLTRSTVNGNLCHFVWISPKQKYGVMWRKGHTCYIDRGSGNCYSQTQSSLVDLNNIHSSPWSGRESIAHHEGRLSKSIFKQWVTKAMELEK